MQKEHGLACLEQMMLSASTNPKINESFPVALTKPYLRRHNVKNMHKQVDRARIRRPLIFAGLLISVCLLGLGVSFHVSSKSQVNIKKSSRPRNEMNVVDPTYVSTFDRVVVEASIKPEESELVGSIQVVIARYAESLEWYNKPEYSSLYANTVVYNKGPNQAYFHPPRITEITLPNVGCESHSYLFHVVQNYHNLADLTIFLPGSSDTQIKLRRAQKVLELANLKPNRSIFACWQVNEPVSNDFTLDEYQQTSGSNRSTNGGARKLVPCHTRPLGEWLKLRIGVDAASLCVTWNAIFAINKRDILKHPISYYQAILDDLSVGVTCEAGHYAERAWFSIFGASDSICFYEPKN
jgi:Protein of unknown function (DUF3431)